MLMETEVWFPIAPFLKCMIDITPYQQRLEWLKEWIQIQINGWFVSAIISLYEETGHFLYVHKDDPYGWTFEEYCKYKHSLTLK